MAPEFEISLAERDQILRWVSEFDGEVEELVDTERIEGVSVYKVGGEPVILYCQENDIGNFTNFRFLTSDKVIEKLQSAGIILTEPKTK